MEESLKTSSTEPAASTQGITSKLPAESASTNTQATEKSGTNSDEQDLASKVIDSMQLVVLEGFQVGRGVARIDPSDMAQMGCQPGDIVMITGGRTTAAKVVPSAIIERGRQTIQMDSKVRQNSASGLGERVIVRKARVSTAEKITLLPLSGGTPIQESDLQYISRYMIGLPVTIGDLLQVGTPGIAPREFLIISTTPATPSYALQKKRSTGDLSAVIPPAMPQPVIETEAVVVQQGTVVKAQARGATHGAPGRVSYEDIGGLGKELQRIREMIELPLKYPAVFDRLGGELERRIVGQLLTLMDGMASRGQVVVIGATNQPNSLDPALRRPGRFDREIGLRVPDVRARTEILRIHSKDAALANDIDFARLAQLTPGFVGADLEALCREAAMIALRRVLPHIDYQRGYIPYETLVNLNITMADFQAALREIEPSTTREVYVEVSETSWDDIGGMERTKELLTEGVEWPLRFPEVYANVKAEPPRGVLLSGPPGSGKTLIARALANQCEASFISIKGPELLSKWVGEAEKGIREVFRHAKQAAPCIVFFDEIDSLAPRRSGDVDRNFSNGVIAQLLTEMDGIEGRQGVIVLGATNRPELIDPALLRPGRFDLVVELEYPDEEERRAIFAVHTRGKAIAPDVTVEELASLTPGRSGADIEAICRRAALLALREWITPRLSIHRVQVTETTEEGEPLNTPKSEAVQEDASLPALPAARFQIRAEHFARAIDEQRERYAIQEEAEESIARQQQGRRRLIEMATNVDASGQPPLRGFRLWLARLFGLVPREA